MAYALAHEQEAAVAQRTTGERVTTVVRDPLTGRLLQDTGGPVRPERGPGSAEQPLRMVFVPANKGEEAESSVESAVQWLRRRTGYAIEGNVLLSYALVVESLASGSADVGFLTATSYARLRYMTDDNGDDDDDIDVILTAVREGNPAYPSSDLAYRAAILVRADSPLQKLEDLTEDHTVALGGPTSGAASLLPTALFNRLGLRPGLQRIEGAYQTRIGAVIQGRVDATSIWWSAPNAKRPRNDARTQAVAYENVFEETRIIGYTGWIPNEPVVVRRALPEAIKRDLQRALSLYVVERSLTEAGRKELLSIGSLVGYIPASNDTYEGLMEVVRVSLATDDELRADFQRKR